MQCDYNFQKFVSNELHQESNSIILLQIMFERPPSMLLKVSHSQVILLGWILMRKMFLLGGMLLVRVLLREAIRDHPTHVVWRCVVSEHLVRAPGSGCDCTGGCMNTRIIKFTGLPGGLQLTLAHIHTQDVQVHTVMHECIHGFLLIGAQIRHVHTLYRTDRGRESFWACKPLIRSI